MMRLEQNLQTLRKQQLFRQRRLLQSPQGINVEVDDEQYLSFCSNDYLGLANDPRLVAAMKRGADQYGVGAGASHLVTGHHAAHHALEEELAEFVGAERALLFSSGYMANLGVVVALSDRHGRIVEDKLNHASLIDAARLARAEVKRYTHNNIEQASIFLQQHSGAALIVSDAVFSMDGDLAALPDLYRLARNNPAWLLVDDAHGLGVLGECGRGSPDHFNIPLADPVIYMGTLGKALGSFGAFVAGSEALIETLIQHARTYIYTTALPPAVAEATRESLRIVRDEDWRRQRLFDLIQYFKTGAADLGLALMPSETAIQPMVIGSAGAASKLADKLQRQGILVPAIRPPTVAPGTARLRITFSAMHERHHVDKLLDVLKSAGNTPA